jgi:hypothetical protein
LLHAASVTKRWKWRVTGAAGIMDISSPNFLFRSGWHIYVLDMAVTHNIMHLALLVELKNNIRALTVVFVSVRSAGLLKE